MILPRGGGDYRGVHHGDACWPLCAESRRSLRAMNLTHCPSCAVATQHPYRLNPVSAKASTVPRLRVP